MLLSHFNLLSYFTKHPFKKKKIICFSILILNARKNNKNINF